MVCNRFELLSLIPCKTCFISDLTVEKNMMTTGSDMHTLNSRKVLKDIATMIDVRAGYVMVLDCSIAHVGWRC